jgi:YedE family putative selenium metabolism protein
MLKLPKGTPMKILRDLVVRPLWLVVITGVIAGTLAGVLVKLGNPPNTGICIVCFIRDIAGGIGLIRIGAFQYIRPQIAGMVLGALLAAVVFKEFKPRTGSAPVIRFFLGMFAAIGAMVFLGCPWRALLRLSGGDWTAIAGVAGLIIGAALGTLFIRQGFAMGESRPASKIVGLIMPAAMIVLVLLIVFKPQFGRDPLGDPFGPVFTSMNGFAAMRINLWIGLVAGMIIGFLAQRSRFCTVGAVKNLILDRSPVLLWGVAAFVVSAFVVNCVFGQFHPGFDNQQFAHNNYLWNFLGMALAGLAFVLGGGCPGRQLFLCGEGDGDAAVFVLGMFAGVTVAHTFFLASTLKGPSLYGPYAVIIGLVFCVLVALTMKKSS